jgi:hypothetical protein
MLKIIVYGVFNRWCLAALGDDPPVDPPAGHGAVPDDVPAADVPPVDLPAGRSSLTRVSNFVSGGASRCSNEMLDHGEAE